MFVQKGQKVWFPHAEHGWELGTVVMMESAGVLVETPAQQQKHFQADSLVEAEEESTTEKEDMVRSNDLSEASLLYNLRMRYSQDKIYTYVGPMLIALNPFKALEEIYSKNMVQQYGGKRLHQLPPHIYAIANEAFVDLQNTGRSQSILISGESGAGKTESTKYVLRYLAEAAPSSKENLRQQILQTNPLLEAFGNAKTVKNNNSSRFGKFIQVCFNERCHITGAMIQTYLLEKSRIVSQAPNERNYHIFYQLVLGSNAEEKQKYQLEGFQVTDFHYLNPQRLNATLDARDAEELSNNFQEVKACMQTIGISDEEQDNVFRALAGILHLGNINFVCNAAREAKIDSNARSSLEQACHLLGLIPDVLESALCSRTFASGGRASVYKVPLNAEQAVEGRDALAKDLYSRLFGWLVSRVNATLYDEEDHRSNSAPNKIIGVLDIFGFEVFPQNSFEQLTINYANEKLFQQLNSFLFECQQKEYAMEGVEWQQISFPDNKDCLNLIEQKPYGILSLLDEECQVPKGNEKSLLDKITAEHDKKNARYASSRKPLHFTIRHFAGEVHYDIQHFLEKNKDTLHADLKTIFQESEDPFLKLLFFVADVDNMAASLPAERPGLKRRMTGQRSQLPPKAPGGLTGGSSSMYAASPNTARRKSGLVTVASTFKQQLTLLMQTIERTNPHYIRCVKTNPGSAPSRFDAVEVLRQLRYSGMIAAVKIRKAGFASRRPYKQFLNRYKSLLEDALGQAIVASVDTSSESACRSVCQKFVDQLPPDQKSQVQLGHTKVFLKAELAEQLEEQREQKMIDKIIRIQRAMKVAILRRRLKKIVAEKRAREREERLRREEEERQRLKRQQEEEERQRQKLLADEEERQRLLKRQQEEERRQQKLQEEQDEERRKLKHQLEQEHRQDWMRKEEEERQRLKHKQEEEQEPRTLTPGAAQPPSPTPLMAQPPTTQQKTPQEPQLPPQGMVIRQRRSGAHQPPAVPPRFRPTITPNNGPPPRTPPSLSPIPSPTTPSSPLMPHSPRGTVMSAASKLEATLGSSPGSQPPPLQPPPIITTLRPSRVQPGIPVLSSPPSPSSGSTSKLEAFFGATPPTVRRKQQPTLPPKQLPNDRRVASCEDIRALDASTLSPSTQEPQQQPPQPPPKLHNLARSLSATSLNQRNSLEPRASPRDEEPKSARTSQYNNEKDDKKQRRGFLMMKTKKKDKAPKEKEKEKERQHNTLQRTNSSPSLKGEITPNSQQQQQQQQDGGRAAAIKRKASEYGSATNNSSVRKTSPQGGDTSAPEGELKKTVTAFVIEEQSGTQIFFNHLRSGANSGGSSPLATPRSSYGSAPIDPSNDEAGGGPQGEEKKKEEAPVFATPEEEAKAMRLRAMAIKETVDTERDYVKDLGVIIKMFILPIRQKGILSEAEINTIFSTIEVIRPLNMQILKELERRVRQPPPDCERFGDIFLQMSEYFKMYSNYCAGQSQQLSLLSALRHKNKEFAAFLLEAEQDQACRGLSLEAYLIKPVQRVCKYPLLLRELLRHTSQSHVDYENLVAALEKIGSVVDYINEGKRLAEQQEQTRAIQDSVVGLKDLVKPARRFLSKGTFLVASQTAQTPQEMMLFLFNDLLVLSKPRSHHTKKGPTYTLEAEVPLDQFAKLMTVSDRDDAFYLSHGSNGWTIQSTKAQTEEWLSMLNSIVQRIKKKYLLDRYASLKRKEGKNAPLPGTSAYLIAQGGAVGQEEEEQHDASAT